MEKIEFILAKISGFNPNILNYCIGTRKELALTGIFYIFQVVILFFVSYILFNYLACINWLISIIMASICCYYFSKILYRIFKWIYNSKSFNVILSIAFLAQPLIVLISILISIRLLESEILFNSFFHNNFSNSKYLGSKAILIAFKNLIVEGEQRTTIIFMIIAIYILMQFIFIRPLITIYKSTNTLYNTFNKFYEQIKIRQPR
jgi:hypothetical protein